MNAPQPPFPLGPLDAGQLLVLLAAGESDWLDYKREVDLSDKADLVEIAKDVGALSLHGGYLLVGASNDGKPSGVPLARPELYDPATLNPKLARYLDGVSCRSKVHEHAGQQYALIFVPPHPDGLAVFSADGAYPDPNDARRTKVAFRSGQVYARHHSKSEPWQQKDVALIKTRLREDREARRQAASEARDLADRLGAELTDPDVGYFIVALAPTLPGAALGGQALLSAVSSVADNLPPELTTSNFHWPLYPVVAGARVLLLTDEGNPRATDLERRVELLPGGAGVAAVRIARVRRPRVGPAWAAVLSDRLELEAVNQVSLLAAWAAAAGASGQANVHVRLQAPQAADAGCATASLIITDDASSGATSPSPVGRPPEPDDARVELEQPVADVVALPHGAVSLAYLAARGLLNAHGRAEPRLLTAAGTVDPTWAYGTGQDRRRLVELAEIRGVLDSGARVP